MKLFKNALAGAAITGLLVSQPVAAAAASRTASSVGEGEDLAGLPAAATPVVAVLGIFFLVAAVALISDGDDDDEPVSP